MIIPCAPKWINQIYRHEGCIYVLRCMRIWILVEYWLRSFSPWLASILLDVAMGGDAVQNPAHVVFIIGKYHYSTKPTVILNFSTPGLFQLLPTVVAALLL